MSDSFYTDIPDGMDRRELLEVLSPFVRSLEIAGLGHLSINYTCNLLKKIFISFGVSRIADTISKWNVMTRVILADEAWTRDVSPIPGVMHTRIAKNYENMYGSFDPGPCRKLTIVDFRKISLHQGSRPIPPYLLDPMSIFGLLPNPSYLQKKVLVELSNLKRILPEGDKQKVVSSMAGFVTNVERVVIPFNLRKVFRQLDHIFGPPISGTESTRVDISFHASLEFAQGKDGKIGEFLSKVICDFLIRPLGDLFEIEPAEDLIDMFGNVLLRLGDFNPEKTVGESLYLSVFSTPSADIHDSRLGLISLYWAMITLLEEEEIMVESDHVPGFPFCRYDRPCQVAYRSGSIRSRVSPQPEEGFKVRVITITSLAVSFIGGVARHILDYDLHSVKEIEIGLLSKTKLYTILDHIGGKLSANFDTDPNKRVQSFVPEHAESVDLTTATDTAPREHVSDVLHAHVDVRDHGVAREFLRMAVDIGCCPRDFIADKSIAHIAVPKVHRCGMMMGEGLAGIYLNDSSAIVRSLAQPFSNRFRTIAGIRTNDDADRYIDLHRVELQGFLDSVVLGGNKASSQSGDDVINFSKENLSASFRILYRIFGFIPSETTWFSSDCYCTFTEEAAIKTYDSKGWKFVDAIKPRAFKSTGIDPFGKVLVSRIHLICTYLRYIPKDSHTWKSALNIIDRMIDENPAWKRIILQYQIPIGLPQFLGGIEHPIGMTENYLLTLPLEDLKVIKGLSDLAPIDAFGFVWEFPEEIQGTAIEMELLIEMQAILMELGSREILSVFIENDTTFTYDLNEVCPFGQSWWKTQESRKAFVRDNHLVSLHEILTTHVRSSALRIMLDKGLSDRPGQKAWTASKNRINKLRQAFAHVTLDPSDVSELSVWKIKERIFNHLRNLVVPKVVADEILNRRSLPSLSFTLKHRSAAAKTVTGGNEITRPLKRLRGDVFGFDTEFENNSP
jgi:hypothetical protein